MGVGAVTVQSDPRSGIIGASSFLLFTVICGTHIRKNRQFPGYG